MSDLKTTSHPDRQPVSQGGGDQGPLVRRGGTTSPEATAVNNYLLYSLSLPERALRSTTAMVGGALRESSGLLVPQAFRSSKSYSMLIEQTLSFLVHDMGGVKQEEGTDGEQIGIENYVARKAVGGFIEMASLPLLHVSPMTVLAIVSDVAYGSQTYLNELSKELKQRGVIDEDTTIDHAADLLDAIKHTAGTTAEALDTPPLSVDGLAETIDQVRQEASRLDPSKALPQTEVERLWNDMHEMAQRENVGVSDIATTMSMYAMNQVGTLGGGALSSVTVAGNMFNRHILDHYSTGLSEIRTNGIYATLYKSSRPYVVAMWHNFSSERETLTEDLFSGRMIGRAWSSVKSWFGTAEGERLPEVPGPNESSS